MNKEDIEILEKLKKYMQDNIDSGYHKFIYNEYEEDKCIDIINAIDKLQKENEELKEENIKLCAELMNKLRRENLGEIK